MILMADHIADGLDIRPGNLRLRGEHIVRHMAYSFRHDFKCTLHAALQQLILTERLEGPDADGILYSRNGFEDFLENDIDATSHQKA